MTEAAPPIPPQNMADMAKGIENLQRLIGPDVKIFTADEVKDIVQLLHHKQALIDFAKYQEARGILIAKWRGLVIGAAALVAASTLLWDKFSLLWHSLGAK